MVTVLRLKRKAEEPAEEILLVRGVENDQRKRMALNRRLAEVDLSPELQVHRFAHTSTVHAEDTQSATLQRCKEACQVACQRLQSSAEDDQSSGPQLGALCEHLMEDIRMYDVLRNEKAAGSTEARRRPWTAAPVSFDIVADGSSAASDVKGGGAQDCVYDLYVVQEDQGAFDTSDWWSSPEVQMLYDGTEFLTDAEDSESISDSEDSNAEMHYTHDYPDDEHSQYGTDISNGDTSEYDSDGDLL